MYLHRVAARLFPSGMAGRLVCVDDFERYASKTLPKYAFDYYRSGADEEITLRDNILAFRRFVEGCHYFRIAYQAFYFTASHFGKL